MFFAIEKCTPLGILLKIKDPKNCKIINFPTLSWIAHPTAILVQYVEINYSPTQSQLIFFMKFFIIYRRPQRSGKNCNVVHQKHFCRINFLKNFYKKHIHDWFYEILGQKLAKLIVQKLSIFGGLRIFVTPLRRILWGT